MHQDRRLQLLLRALLAAVLCFAVRGDLEQQSSHSARHRTWFWSSFDPDTAPPTTLVRRDDWVAASHLFFHVNRFYAVVPASEAAANGSTHSGPFSISTPAHALPVADVAAFYCNIRAARVEGTTLWVDVPFSSRPEHLGHWMETLAPVYSQLARGVWREAAEAVDAAAAQRKISAGDDATETLDPGAQPLPYIRTVLVPGLTRAAVAASPYATELLAVAVAPGLRPGQSMPRLLFWDDIGGGNTSTWLAFECALRIYSSYDHPAGGAQGFASPQLGAEFRAAVHKAAGVPPRPAAAPPPRLITYLMPGPGIGPTVANNGAVLQALRDAAAPSGFAVRPYSPTSAVPLSSLASIMSHTGVLVGRSGPALAAAVLLPPGAVVVELLPHNWEFAGVHELYRNLTRSVGDVAHVAWKAPGPGSMVYATPSDARYARWTPAECTSESCLDAQEHARLRVDPGVLRTLAAAAAAAAAGGGAALAELEARHPWPARFNATGTTGLWWDVA